ncbi:hypothetical protein [Verminephrobacter eiseniae]|uniref:hypothetical protein n=1 Tax=Verminephrobacter eiseniae TaxID=364317 RepID=UPI002238B8E8|nr:hypothetical protein [Verminephrobacter eiseniae]MCW5237687.1 hypothetical protein [Verminephrobacter eiseniae]
MARFEVLGREDDCALIRSLVERLAEDDPQAKLIAAVAQANGSTTIASQTMKSISQETQSELPRSIWQTPISHHSMIQVCHDAGNTQ